ncbi:MAG TPA: DEAD/DEAH box helicase, partial [Candidatus Acetothermia bacterium]|nr:DEAD/DEAH box helicase [Candidatus Acetothermia bacterium]
MRIEELVRSEGLPEEVAHILESHGVRDLYPPQWAAIEAGALAGRSLVLAAPTASGKTLVAELACLKAALKKGGRTLYLVPLRALASEKYEDLKAKYSRLGIKVGISVGDYDRVQGRLAEADILILTNERADSLLRHRASWLTEGLALVVLDEVHLLTDPSRGPTLEVVVAALRQRRPDVQLLALSATISNAREIADWLSAQAVVSDFRPVPLRTGVYLDGELLLSDGTKRQVDGGLGPVTDLVREVVGEGGQVLVFVATRRSTQAAARRLSRPLQASLSPEQKRELEKLARRVEGALEESTPVCRELAACLANGVAFHHAGLHPAQRRLVEQAFREGLLKVVCTTTTLAAGVNLPARRVIIRDLHRYYPGLGAGWIPALEFHQMAGRAGRPGLDPYGEAVLIAKGEEDREELLARYLLAPPERIVSQLQQSGNLPAYLLGTIVAGYASTPQQVMEFFSRTLLAHQFGLERLRELLGEALQFLLAEELVRSWGGGLHPTPFGELVAKLYIHPLSGVVLREGLRRAAGRAPGELAQLNKESEFLLPVPGPQEPGYREFLEEVKVSLALRAWINEASEAELEEEFG